MKNVVNAKGKFARRAYLGLLGSLVLLTACSSGLESQPELSLDPQASSCLSSSGQLIRMSGTYRGKTFIHRKSNANVDARGARFLANRGGLVIADNRNSFCLSGGTFNNGLSLSASWDTYHSSPTIAMFSTPSATLENMAIENTGDGLTVKEGSSGYLWRNSYVRNAGDDFIEDDRYSGGTVDNVLVDATFMGISCRSEGKGNRRNYTINVKNSLIAMSARRSAYLYKVSLGSASYCKINLSNNVILLPKNAGPLDPADKQGVNHNPLRCSSKSTIVYTGGDKRYLESLKRTRRDCFNVTTDKSVWTKARNAWFSKNSQFSKYR